MRSSLFLATLTQLKVTNVIQSYAETVVIDFENAGRKDPARGEKAVLMANRVLTPFETGRLIKFPNVSSFVAADQLTEYYHLHRGQDFGIVAEKQVVANRNAIMQGKGEVLSEYAVSASTRIRFTTTVGFKTVVTVVDREGHLVVDGY